MRSRLLTLALTVGLGACSQTVSPSAEEVCEALAACESDVEVEECISSTEPEVDRAVVSGCVAEASAYNACLVNELSAECRPVRRLVVGGPCEAAAEAVTRCVRGGGGAVDFHCRVDSGSYCSSYLGTASDPASVCDLLEGELVEACAPDDALGRCTYATSFGTTILTYDADSPLDASAYEGICTDSGGEWSEL